MGTCIHGRDFRKHCDECDKATQPRKKAPDAAKLAARYQTLHEANKAPLVSGWGCVLYPLLAVIGLVFVLIPAYRLLTN